MKWNWKEFLIAAALRAVRTFAQAFIAAVGIDGAMQTFAQVDWLRALSVAGVSAVLSIATSLATGLPEVQKDPVIQPPDDPEPGTEG